MKRNSNTSRPKTINTVTTLNISYGSAGESERCWERTELIAEDDRGQGVNDDEQSERQDDGVDVRGAVDEANHQAFDESAQDQSADERCRETDPVGVARVDDDECDVGGEHCHRGLGEVDDARRAPNEHEGEREGGVDHAARHAVEEDGEQLLHCRWRPFGSSESEVGVAEGWVLGEYGRWSFDGDLAEVEDDGMLGDGQRTACVLFDEYDCHRLRVDEGGDDLEDLSDDLRP